MAWNIYHAFYVYFLSFAYKYNSSLHFIWAITNSTKDNNLLFYFYFYF